MAELKKLVVEKLLAMNSKNLKAKKPAEKKLPSDLNKVTKL